MSEIMEVPFPFAASRFLMSFLTLNISICWSSSSFDDMVTVTVVGGGGGRSVSGEVDRKVLLLRKCGTWPIVAKN